MTRRLHNWTYKDLTHFLTENGFRYNRELFGSHREWIKVGENGEADRLLELNFTHHSYHVKTIKIFIRHPGIHQDQWIRWAAS